MRLTGLDIGTLTETLVYCLAAEGRSPRTTEWYQANLGKFASYLERHGLSLSVQEIGIDEVRRFIRHQQTEVVRWENVPDVHDTARLSPSTINGCERSTRRSEATW